MDVVDKIKKGFQARQWHGDRPGKIVKMQIAACCPTKNNSPQGYAGKRPAVFQATDHKTIRFVTNVKGIVHRIAAWASQIYGWIRAAFRQSTPFPS